MKALRPVLKSLLAGLLAVPAFGTRADVITDWSIRTGELITEARIGTPPAVRIVALVQTAAYGAVNAVTQRHPAVSPAQVAARRALIDAAVAAAHRATLLELLPAQRTSIEVAYQAALAPVADDPATAAGVAIGERAAAEALAQRLHEGASSPEAYRPHTTAGAYVPTAAVFVPQWPQRKPWLMTSAAQFRPARAPRTQRRAMAQRLQRSEGLRRQGEHAPQHRTDRGRALLGVLVAGDLPRRGAFGGAAAGPRRGAQCAPVRIGGTGDGRRLDQRLRGQVPLRLLASGDRDPQRRRRRP